MHSSKATQAAVALALAGVLWGFAPGHGSATAEAAAAQAPSAPATQENQPVRISVEGVAPDQQIGRWDPKARRWIFNPPGGTVVVEWGDWRAEAARLEWDSEGRTVELSGSVKLTQAEVDGAAERVMVWYDERRVRLSGSARLDQFEVVDHKRGKKVRTLTAPFIEVDDRRGLLVAESGVEVRQDDPRLWATGERLTYDRASELLVLTAKENRVRATLEGFKLEKASRIEYNAQTDEVRLFGPAEIIQLPPEPASSTSP